MNEKIKKLIEDAKSKCKSQYGEGHYSQTAFWHFIVEIERELNSGSRQLHERDRG